MFSASAKFYDAIYTAFKNYEAESASVAALVRAGPTRFSTLPAAQANTPDTYDISMVLMSPAWISTPAS